MNKKTSYIVIFSLLVVLTIGIIFTDYIKQLGTILADASIPNPGHSLSEIEGWETLVKTSGDQTLGGTKTFSSAIVLSTAGTATTHAVRADRTISTTNGITGGGNLTANRTLSLDSTVVRTTGNQTLAGTKTFSSPVVVATPTETTHATTKAYVDSAIYNALFNILIDPRDFNIYPTVQIGTQCWMAKNLAYLPSVVGPGTGSETTPHYYVYDYDGTNVADAKATYDYTTYGVLYNWPAATTACPSGWHLPNDTEWKTLEMSLGMTQAQADAEQWRGTDQGAKLKMGGSSGFNARITGFRASNGSFSSDNSLTYFWTSNGATATNAWRRYLYQGSTMVNRYHSSKAAGFSVRCLRD